MRNSILLLLLLTICLGCQDTNRAFEFTLKGSVIGQDTGQLVYSLSPRVGDEIVIPFSNGVFEHNGTATEIYLSGIAFEEDMVSGAWMEFPFVVEPGVIEIELSRDSILYGSKVLQGKENIGVAKANRQIFKYFERIYMGEYSMPEIDSLWDNYYTDSVLLIIEDNAENFASLFLINRFSDMDLWSADKITKALQKITNPAIRRSFYFKKAKSKLIALDNNIGEKGTQAINFSLPDSSGVYQDFNSIAKGKFVFVEESGSWCGNQTNDTRKLKEIYDRYNHYGLEIITIVCESNRDRWMSWLRSEKYPWPNLLEIELNNPNKTIYTAQVFSHGDYLVDEEGMIIANGLSAEKLNELLMERYEPEVYAEYLIAKWEMPDGIEILDKGNGITSMDKLCSMFEDQAIFIDCYATWCSPCINEFQYKTELKEFLDKHDIVLVYIGFDHMLGDAKWLKFIKDHDLKGYHMRVNDVFNVSYMEEIRSRKLPTYILINNEGEIVERDAFPPSDSKALFEQISNKLKL